MSGNKLVLVGLVLIAVLFAGGVVAGAMGEDERGDNPEDKDSPDWTETMDGVLSFAKGFRSRAALDGIEVKPPEFGSAKSVITIPAGRECILRVPKWDKPDIRSLDLVVGDGIAVTVTVLMKDKDKDKVKSKTYQPREKTTLAVRKDGLDITVRAEGTQGVAKIKLE